MRIMLLLFWGLAWILPLSAQASFGTMSSEKEKKDKIPIAKIPDEQSPKSENIQQSFRNGVDFLLQTQNADGSWGDHRVIGTWNVLCPYPDGPLTFRTASTALCIAGLNASPMKDEPAVREAIIRAEDYLFKNMPRLKRSDALCVYNVWAHTYVLDAMCMRANTEGPSSPRFQQLKACAHDQIKRLNELASAKGGWGYLTYSGFSKRPASDPTSFLTASVLISLHMAHETFQLQADEKITTRALTYLKSQRTPAGTYVYSLPHTYYPGRLINRHTGSLARTPACDYAIRLTDQPFISLTQLIDGLDRLWSRRGWLTMSLHKPTPHESFAQNSGYFFYYGYYYAGMCLHMLPAAAVKRHADFLANDLLRRQCTDGSWWDYPLYNYHKFYGTGYALYALAQANHFLKPGD